MMKICSKCNIDKPFSDFYKNGKYLMPLCKECFKEKQLIYISVNKEKIKQYRKTEKYKKYKKDYKKTGKYKEYRIKEEVRAKAALYSKNYREKNLLKTREIAKRSREKNSDKINKYQADYYVNNKIEILNKRKCYLKSERYKDRIRGYTKSEQYIKRKRANSKSWLKIAIGQLKTSYLKNEIKKQFKLLGLTNDLANQTLDAYPVLINLKRVQIQTKREIKKQIHDNRNS
jgi:hypothetical protein